MKTESIQGSRFIVYPLETHHFLTSRQAGSGKDFLCSQCNRPRALHQPHETVTVPSDIDPYLPRIRSANLNSIVGAPLTDRKISSYMKKGYYNDEYRSARKQFCERKRQGGYVERDGRLIYSP